MTIPANIDDERINSIELKEIKKSFLTFDTFTNESIDHIHHLLWIMRVANQDPKDRWVIGQWLVHHDFQPGPGPIDGFLRPIIPCILADL